MDGERRIIGSPVRYEYAQQLPDPQEGLIYDGWVPVDSTDADQGADLEDDDGGSTEGAHDGAGIPVVPLRGRTFCDRCYLIYIEGWRPVDVSGDDEDRARAGASTDGGSTTDDGGDETEVVIPPVFKQHNFFPHPDAHPNVLPSHFRQPSQSGALNSPQSPASTATTRPSSPLRCKGCLGWA